MKNNVSLRVWQKQDAQVLAAIANNRNIWNNVRDQFPSPYTVLNALEWIDHSNKQQPVQNLAIIYQGKPVGNIGLVLQKDVYRKSIEIGYFVGEEFWGNGIATQALKQFLVYVQDQFQPIRMYAEVFEHNKASMEVLKRNGFFLESIRRKAAIKNGQTIDDFVWVKLTSSPINT